MYDRLQQKKKLESTLSKNNPKITLNDPILDQFFSPHIKENQPLETFKHGYIYEIYGEAGSGKTNFCLHLALQNILPDRSELYYKGKKYSRTVIYLSIYKNIHPRQLE